MANTDRHVSGPEKSSGKNADARKPGEMPFLDHLEELRRRILLVAAGFVVLSAAAFPFAGYAVAEAVKFLSGMGGTLIAVRPAEKFLAYMKIALVAGGIGIVPLALHQAASFVRPALQPGEKKILGSSIAASLLLGLGGAAFALFVLIPFAFGFFANFSGADGIANYWSFGECIDLAVGLGAATVLSFQFPLALVAAMWLGIVSPSTLSKYRRHAVIVILVIAAIVTPPDIVSQIAVAVVLWVLYEATAAIGTIAARKREAGSRSEETAKA